MGNYHATGLEAGLSALRSPPQSQDPPPATEAGLTGVGMQARSAVPAVLLYRLAAYWLPVLPGWLCWRFLQHRGYA